MSILFSLLSVVFFFWNLIKSDYSGVITKLKEDNFTLEPINADEEADYNVNKIYFKEETRIIGNTDNDLKVRQHIKVWAEEINERKVANKIKIITEK